LLTCNFVRLGSGSLNVREDHEILSEENRRGSIKAPFQPHDPSIVNCSHVDISKICTATVAGASQLVVTL
jgi:hypothetical protein